MADSQLVSDDNVRNFDSFLGLLVGVLVPVQLRVDRTELQVQSALKLHFVDARGDALVLERLVLFIVELFEACLEAEGALLQLAQLLITHRHVVEYLERYLAVSAAA